MTVLVETTCDVPMVSALTSCDAQMLAWYAVYTRSRQENVVKNQLDGKEIENFLPLYERVSHWKDRKKRIKFPLFPGYLFVRIDPRERLQVLKTVGVVCLVGSNGLLLPIPEEQILSVQMLLENRLKFDPHPYLTVGKRVRITDGPLIGIEGILSCKKNRSCLIVSVDMIQRSVSVELESWKVEAI
jgi:transcription termination/antitermination protein NusG